MAPDAGTAPGADPVAATVAVRRRVPVALAWLLGPAVLCTVLTRTVWPGLPGLLDRDPEALRHGQVWRVVTPLLLQPGPLAVAVVVLALVGVVGWLAERWFGSLPMTVLWLGGGVAANLVGFAWDPSGAGVSLAGCGVLGGFGVWWLRMRRSGPVSAGGWVLLIGVFLAVTRDVHGVALLVGAALGVVVLRGVPAVYRGRVRG